MTDTSIKTATFTELWQHWPIGGTSSFVKAAGGNLGAALAEAKNDSAARLSAAFNGAGHPIQHSTLFSGKEVTGADGQRFIVATEDMLRLLSDKFGKARHCPTQAGAAGRQGILTFKLKDGSSSVALWDGTATKEAAEDRWTEAAEAHLYELGHAAHTGGTERHRF